MRTGHDLAYKGVTAISKPNSLVADKLQHLSWRETKKSPALVPGFFICA